MWLVRAAFLAIPFTTSAYLSKEHVEYSEVDAENYQDAANQQKPDEKNCIGRPETFSNLHKSLIPFTGAAKAIPRPNGPSMQFCPSMAQKYAEIIGRPNGGKRSNARRES